jgi:hypothetical protein
MAGMSGGSQQRVKDGVAWRIGDERDVEWISDGTASSRRITAAIPPVFVAYATLVHPGEPGVPRDVYRERQQDLALVELLRRHSPERPWWLGYLDTGASDIVFWEAPTVMLYTGWHYVLIQAGPEQAATWRPAGGESNWKSTELPDLMFPDDHSWLVSTLWDDDWSCIGGSEVLIADLLLDPVLGRHARRITLDEDATPPGRAVR